MPKYELYIPSQTLHKRGDVLLVEGDSWMEALNAGLRDKPEQSLLKNIRCDIIPGGMLIRDSASAQVFHMHELRIETPSKAPPPPSPGLAHPSNGCLGAGVCGQGRLSILASTLA